MDELSRLALKHGSDKYGHHYYTPIYYQLLKDIKDEPLIVLEIGVGGYYHLDIGGFGLKMWSSFFLNGKIYGIDIYDKSFLDSTNIQTFIVSQTDQESLETLISNIGRPNIIVDDGSHLNSDVIKSFEILFPLLAEGGFYFIEDCHTSYWDIVATDGVDYQGGFHENTSVEYCKRLIESVNYEHTPRAPHPRIKGVESVQFYKELIIIKKESNVIQSQGSSEV